MGHKIRHNESEDIYFYVMISVVYISSFMGFPFKLIKASSAIETHATFWVLLGRTVL